MVERPVDGVTVELSSIDGYGVFTRRVVARGTVVLVVTGEHTSTRTSYSYQIDADSHLEPTHLGRFLNHSCDPTCWVRVRADRMLEVVTARDVASGCELTVDYATFEQTLPAGPVPCRCGAAACRDLLTGYRDLPSQVRLRLAPHLLPYLRALGL